MLVLNFFSLELFSFVFLPQEENKAKAIIIVVILLIRDKITVKLSTEN